MSSLRDSVLEAFAIHQNEVSLEEIYAHVIKDGERLNPLVVEATKHKIRGVLVNLTHGGWAERIGHGKYRLIKRD